MRQFYSSFGIFILLFMGAHSETHPIVTIKSGQIKGIVLKSHEGRDYHAFMSIPYGKSTAGLLRFKPPNRVDSWDGIFDATRTDVVECSQLNFQTNKPTGSEDCLVISVYVPQHEPDTALPVLVFIHGGGFALGSGSRDFYGPEKFMDHNVILVTFNYRLGIFGFFNTEDSVSPGNYGMLDQVLALRWVNENIASFGGDPEYITIFGESAGGASVVYHMISPLSQGLFSSAIAQSGTILNPWAFQKKPLEWANKLAEKVHCPTISTIDTLDCFQQSSAEILIDGSSQLIEVGSLLPCYAAPSIEGPGGEGFLTDDPIALMKGRKIHQVPFFAGMLRDDGYMGYALLTKKFKNKGQKFLDEDFSKYVKLALNVDPEMTDLMDAIKKEYFENVNLNNSKVFKDQLIKMLTDGLFGAGITQTLDLFDDANIPTFGYLYTHQSDKGFAEVVGGRSGEYVSHADELLIQFQFAHPAFQPTNINDTKLSTLMNSIWASIAAGKALSITSGDKEVDWERYDRNERSYLNLNLQPRMEKGKLCAKDDFWVETVPKLLKESALKDEL